jgi:hypothetical protein
MRPMMLVRGGFVVGVRATGVDVDEKEAAQS